MTLSGKKEMKAENDDTMEQLNYTISQDKKQIGICGELAAINGEKKRVDGHH